MNIHRNFTLDINGNPTSKAFVPKIFLNPCTKKKKSNLKKRKKKNEL